MALGNQQKNTLGQYADLLKRNPGIIKLRVSVGHFRYFTREMGGGSGYPIFVSALEHYEGESPAVFRRNWLATCRYEYTVEAKLQEVCNYLAGRGCDMDRVEISGLASTTPR